MNIRIRILTNCNKSWAVVLLLAVFAFNGCAKKTEDQIPDLSPEQAEKVTQLMVDWLECEECLDNELDRVVANGRHLRPLLISTLKRGPSDSSRELLRIELEKRYDKIKAYARTHPNVKFESTREVFVTLYLGNFEAHYQSRAAIALGAIGGEASRRALKEALESTAREDVKGQVRESLEGIK
jgi:hypothetical protein